MKKTLLTALDVFRGIVIGCLVSYALLQLWSAGGDTVFRYAGY